MRMLVVLMLSLASSVALACSTTDPLVKDARYCGTDAAQKGQRIIVIPPTNNGSTYEGLVKASTNG